MSFSPQVSASVKPYCNLTNLETAEDVMQFTVELVENEEPRVPSNVRLRKQMHRARRPQIGRLIMEVASLRQRKIRTVGQKNPFPLINPHQCELGLVKRVSSGTSLRQRHRAIVGLSSRRRCLDRWKRGAIVGRAGSTLRAG